MSATSHPASGRGRSSRSGTTASPPLAAAEAKARLGIVAAQFDQHFGEILVVDPAHPLEPGEFAARHQLQVVDQPRHARIVAIGLLRLQRQALGQAARADPAGIERLDQLQPGFGPVERDAVLGGNLAQRQREIACLVKLVDQSPRHVQGLRIGRMVTKLRADLGMEVLRQRFRACPALLDRGAFAIEATTAATGAFECRFAAPEITGIPVAIQSAAVYVERAVLLGAALADQLIDRG